MYQYTVYAKVANREIELKTFLTLTANQKERQKNLSNTTVHVSVTCESKRSSECSETFRDLTDDDPRIDYRGKREAE